MSEYHYPQLSRSKGIRLLRLLPGEDAHLRCDLFEYSLDSSKPSHPYEALSYVWGSENKPKPITVNNQNLHITENLYTALLHLRDDPCSRVLWVDAICIDQASQKEKEDQIPLMAEIYAKARQVVVWLGEAEGGGDRALEEICRAGESSASLLSAESSQEVIRQLLERPWFQRIWVLQEMAAARHVLIICGSIEVDGHAFCSGLDFLSRTMKIATPQVGFLIRGAVFRAKSLPRTQGELSLDICSLGELLDMYHAHQATKRSDMVYALRSMCLDDLQAAKLDPDYNVPWSILMQHLVKFLLGNHVSVRTWESKERALIKAKGCILGKVSEVEINIGLGGGETLEAIFENTSNQMEFSRIGSARWTLPTSAKLIQKGDLICLLQKSSKFAIIRLRGDHFSVVRLAASPPKQLKTGDTINWSELRAASVTREFSLLWDWKISSEEFQNREKYNEFMLMNKLQLDEEAGLESDLSTASRKWYVALILGDLGEYGEAEEGLRMAVEGYENVIWREQRGTLKCRYGLTPLGWAASSGCDVVVSLLLTKDDVDIHLKDGQYGRTPLLWAAENGHGGIVKQLLDTGEADINSRDKHGQTSLSLAAENGHDGVMKLLLDTGKVDVDAKDDNNRTPLSWAAQKGHEKVFKLLLETGKVDTDSKDNGDRTPLSWAAGNGHERVVKLLFETGKVDTDSKDNEDRTPLSWATQNGHERVVKLLLETGKVDTDSKDDKGRILLSLAAMNGHEAVVKLLLETGKIEINSNDEDRTPLLWATQNGHERVVKLLLETGKVDTDSKDDKGRTLLSLAAGNGHERVVKLLLETGKVNTDSEDNEDRTPLSWAARNGHERVVKLLLETGKVDTDSEDNEDQTPLLWAAKNGYEGVVKLLLETDKVDADSKDNTNRTPLLWAAENGYEGVVKLLLETGKVDTDSKDNYYNRTPLLWAAGNGYKRVVKLLLETGKVDADSEDNEDRTPLSWAAENGYEGVVKLLLETGKVDTDLKDKYYNRTPLSWAAGNGHEAVVKLLLETGKVDADSQNNEDRTPLSWAAGNGHESVVKLLLETGKVDADSQNNEDRTPLSWAAGNGHEAVVKLLLETGKVDANSKDSQLNWTPLSWAAKYKHKGVVKLLQTFSQSPPYPPS